MRHAAKIRAARINSGKSEQEVATIVGVSVAAWGDVEQHDDEAATCLSLAQVITLAGVLRLSPRDVLSGAVAGGVLDEFGPEQFRDAVVAHVASRGVSLEELEEDVGWELHSIVDKPALVLDRPVVFLADACAPLGIDWLAFVPRRADAQLAAQGNAADVA